MKQIYTRNNLRPKPYWSVNTLHFTTLRSTKHFTILAKDVTVFVIFWWFKHPLVTDLPSVFSEWVGWKGAKPGKDPTNVLIINPRSGSFHVLAARWIAGVSGLCERYQRNTMCESCQICCCVKCGWDWHVLTRLCIYIVVGNRELIGVTAGAIKDKLYLRYIKTQVCFLF